MKVYYITMYGGNPYAMVRHVYLFPVHRNRNSDISPVKAIDLYATFAKGIGTDISSGFLFRPATSDSAVADDSPLSSLAADSRLKAHLYAKGTFSRQEHFTGLDRVVPSLLPLRVVNYWMLQGMSVAIIALLQPIM